MYISRLIFLIIFISSFQCRGTAQASDSINKERTSYYSVKISDTSNNNFFEHHPKVEKLTISYSSNKPYEIFVDFKNDKTKEHREFYELQYEVDSFIFKTLYGNIYHITPLIQNSLNRLVVYSCKECEIATVAIYKDTTRYSSNKPYIIAYDRKDSDRRVLATPPKYKGDMSLIANKIQLYNKRVFKPADSIIVLRGVINEKGILGSLELLVGRKSAYSDLVQKQFEASAWQPVRLRGMGRLMQSYIKIYIKRNKDGAVTILTSPRKMRNLNGK